MSRNIPLAIKNIKNEMQALKGFQELSGGQLITEAASAVWQGEIDRTQPIGTFSILAAFEATFTRTDGANKPPLVDFAFLITPQIDDKVQYLHGNVIATGENSVTFRITIDALGWWPFGSSNTGNIEINISAYSPVAGYLDIERVYS